MQQRELSTATNATGASTPSNGVIHQALPRPKLRGPASGGECSPWPLLCRPPQKAEAWHLEEMSRCLERLTEGQVRVEALLQQRGIQGLSELFPDPSQGKPLELGEALQAMYLKQDRLERRFETCMDDWQQKVALEVSEKIINSIGSSMPRSNSPGGKRARQSAAARKKSNREGEGDKLIDKTGSQKPDTEATLNDMKQLEEQMAHIQSLEPNRRATIVKNLKKKEAGMKGGGAGGGGGGGDSADDATPSVTKLFEDEKPHNPIGKVLYAVVNHPAFDGICALMIIFNSVLIGISVQEKATSGEEAKWMEITAHACNCFFLVELIMRMSLKGKNYFISDEWTWNTFDFTLVMFSIVDVIMTETLGQSASSVGSGMKTIKMLRIVRIFRVFRFFRELSLLALMIADSIKSLLWALLMLTIIIYVFAICFTQACSDFKWANENEKRTTQEEVEQLDKVLTQFGTLPKTIYYLILAMLGGISWGEVSDTLIHVDTLSTCLFFFYIFFTLLAVLNIITGVFVDNAVETARTQRDYLASKERQIREKYVADMQNFFLKMDEDGSGTVTLKEMMKYFKDERISNMFAALGIDPGDMERLFLLLDDDGSGEINVDEFLEGCLRLKGEAKSIDVHTCLSVARRIQKRMEDLFPEDERRVED